MSMNRQLEQRLRDLRAEYVYGQESLVELESKWAALEGTLLGLGSTIHVLEEELSKENGRHNGLKRQIR